MANEEQKEKDRINAKSEDKGKKSETMDKCEIMQEERNENADLENSA